MRENEIIKALEYCLAQGITSECERCRDKIGCRDTLLRDALALIHRQAAEIEGLKEDKEALINGQITLQEKLPGVIKAEAYKEFADKLIAKAEIVAGGDYGFVYEIGEDDIDKLLAEMRRGNETRKST